MKYWMTTAAVAGLVACAGCAAIAPFPGHRAKYQDTDTASKLKTNSVESNDLQQAVQAAVSRIVASPQLSNPSLPPRYIVEATHFTTDSMHEEINPEVLADLVRNELINASNGGVAVLTTRHAEPVVHVAEDGKEMTVEPHVQAEYAVGGRVTDVVDSDGLRQDAYTQILIEVVNLESNQVVLSEMHSIKKSASPARQWKNF